MASSTLFICSEIDILHIVSWAIFFHREVEDGPDADRKVELKFEERPKMWVKIRTECGLR